LTLYAHLAHGSNQALSEEVGFRNLESSMDASRLSGRPSPSHCCTSTEHMKPRRAKHRVGVAGCAPTFATEWTVRDVRYALRTLSSTPGVTFTLVLVLAH
jgi:hypothetical protein